MPDRRRYRELKEMVLVESEASISEKKWYRLQITPKIYRDYYGKALLECDVRFVHIWINQKMLFELVYNDDVITHF